MPVLDAKKLFDNRVEAIRDYHKKAGLERAQLDVSGGVDSAVMLGLLAEALGPGKVTAVYSGIHSSKDSRLRAHRVANKFGVDLLDLDLSDVFTNIVNECLAAYNNTHGSQLRAETMQPVYDRLKSDPTVEGSLRSCLRAPIGRFCNRMLGNGIRHGTGNECEDRWLRFYQKGGDGEVDTNPLAMLSKGEVYQLAVYMGVPEEIITAVPSPDLQANGHAHSDEAELEALYGIPLTYSRVNMNGEYTKVGTIEKVSRLMDAVNSGTGIPRTDAGFLKKNKTLPGFNRLCDAAASLFADWYIDDLLDFLSKCDEIEESTRHKALPTPTLGERDDFLEIHIRNKTVREGILTNELPAL